MIKHAKDCTVRIFMQCLFEKDFSGLQGGKQDEWDAIFTEYIDLSGIGLTREYELLSAMHNIQVRQLYIDKQLALQYTFFTRFQIPFINAFDDFRKYGHRLTWNAEKPGEFIGQLGRVELEERRFVAEYDTFKKEYDNIKKHGVKEDGNSRLQFVRQLNLLNKEGYKIDRDKTDMEELSLMIRDYNEMIQEMQNRKRTA